MRAETDDGWAAAAALIDRIMKRFDLGDHWAYHARHAGDRVYGMSAGQLKGLYASAALVVNLHGGTEPLTEHYANGRLIYIGTDACEVEIELYHNVQQTIAFLEP